jgi:A/G-specific adenine glycosylase
VEAELLTWFREHGRDLPWRRTRDPYAILVSEVMSQQYRVEIEELPAMQAFSA